MEQEIDRENAFLLFATFAGDVERTAHALNVRAVDVLRMAEAEGWLDKLGPILALKKSTRPGDLERAINRALNFVQAHRMRLFVSRVLNKLCNLNEEEFRTYLLTSTDAKGNVHDKLSTRAIADLASALEKAQSMSYLALSDSVQDRAKRSEHEGDEGAKMDVHAQIAAAMAQVKSSNTPRALLFDEQVQAGQQVALEAEAKSVADRTPYNRDS